MSTHPAASFRVTPNPVSDFSPRTDPVDMVLRVEQPMKPLLPAADARVRRARHGLDLVVRLAAENGLSVIGWDVRSPEAREEVIHLTVHNAALAHLGLHDSQVTTHFGLNSRADDRARVASFWEARAAMRCVVQTAIDVLGLDVVVLELTRQVRARAR